jgi:hypothetical protein
MTPRSGLIGSLTFAVLGVPAAIAWVSRDVRPASHPTIDSTRVSTFPLAPLLTGAKPGAAAVAEMTSLAAVQKQTHRPPPAPPCR